MSLTTALALLGALVLIALGVHGYWTARRVERPRPADAAIRGAGDAVAVESGRLEPGFDAAAAVDTDESPDEATPRLLRRRGPMHLDALIDALVSLAVDAPLPGEVVLAQLPATRRAGTKPFLVEGLNADDGRWETPVAGRRYSEFQAGVQLANRAGPLNEIEYSEFVQKVEGLAQSLAAMADVPDMLEVVARARELDAFAGAHDAQLAVRLVARGAAWSVAYLRQQAQLQGFVPGVVPGRLILPSREDGAPPMLTLGFDSQAALADDPGQAAVRDVTLGFDVPQTDAAEAPFERWRASARALALSLEAELVDDAGRPLSDEGFGVIGEALGQLYAALDERELPAGSAAARRLFS